MMGLYRIKNLVNHKRYYGSSMDLEKREYKHFWCLRNNIHRNQYLQNAYNKYGEENFEFEILLEIKNADDLLEQEQLLIDFLKPEYNIAKVAGNTMQGRNHSKETRRKMSQAQMGEKNHIWGKKLSEETKNKISESHKGKKHSEETKKKMSIAKKNMSEETKQKISEAHKGKKNSEKTKQKMSITAKNMSEETKKKMSENHADVSGENNPNSKLNSHQVKEIKKLLKEGNLSQIKIAEMFSVGGNIISRIKRRKSWSHLK